MLLGVAARVGDGHRLPVAGASGRLPAHHRRSLYTHGARPDAPPGVRVLSRVRPQRRPAPLDGKDAIAQIEVVPAAGFSGADIPATPGELALATAVAANLL